MTARSIYTIKWIEEELLYEFQERFGDVPWYTDPLLFTSREAALAYWHKDDAVYGPRQGFYLRVDEVTLIDD